MGTQADAPAGISNAADIKKKGGVNVKGRYCYNPMTPRKIGRRVTLADRIRRAIARSKAEKPDVYEIIGYSAPIIPGK